MKFFILETMYSGCLHYNKYKAPAKRPQHFNATYRKNVGRSLLRALAILLRSVATCYNTLGVVGSNLKKVNFFRQHLWLLHDVVVV